MLKQMDYMKQNYLREGVQDLFIGQIQCILDTGRVDAINRLTSEESQNNLLDSVKHLVVVNAFSYSITPTGSHHSTEEAISLIRQRAVLIIQEIDE